MKKTKRRREESVWWGTIKLVQSKKKHLECNIEIQRHYNQSKYSRTWNSLLSSLRSKKYSKVQHLENPLTVVRKHMGILLRRNEHSHTLPKKTECRWELMQPAMMISSNHRATPERVVLQSLPRSPTADKMTLRHTSVTTRSSVRFPLTQTEQLMKIWQTHNQTTESWMGPSAKRQNFRNEGLTRQGLLAFSSPLFPTLSLLEHLFLCS